MSELEIKELQELQAKIIYFSNELKQLDHSRRYVFGEGQETNSRCNIDFPNSTVHFGTIPGLTQKIFNLAYDGLLNHLHKLIGERDKLFICIKQSSYKPIDILDKE